MARQERLGPLLDRQAISFILGVPWSAAKTLRASSSPVAMPTMPAARQMYSQVLSTPPSWKSWYPPLVAKEIVYPWYALSVPVRPVE